MWTAKVTCTGKTPNAGSTPPTTRVQFGPNYGEGKNSEWAASTPTLDLSMSVLDAVAELVELGDAITLTFAKDQGEQAVAAD